MYKCTQCGHLKASLGSSPAYKCRRTATESEEEVGVSDSCSVCHCFAFFALVPEPEPEPEWATPQKPPKGQKPIGHVRGWSVDRTVIKPTRPVLLCESCHGDGNGNGNDQEVPAKQRIRMLERFSLAVKELAKTSHQEQQQQQQQQVAAPQQLPKATDSDSKTLDEQEHVHVDKVLELELKLESPRHDSREVQRKSSGHSLHKSRGLRSIRSDFKMAESLHKHKTVARLAKSKLQVSIQLKKAQMELEKQERHQLRAQARKERNKRQSGGAGGGGGNLYTPTAPSMWQGEELERLFGVSPPCQDKGNARADALLSSLVEWLQEQATKSQDQNRHRKAQTPDSLQLSKARQLKQLVASVVPVKRCSYQGILQGSATRSICLVKRTDCTMPTKVDTPSLATQFRPVSYTDEELLGVLMDKYQMLADRRPMDLIMRCEPIHCPDARCTRMCFPSDLHVHLLYDHQRLIVEQVGVRQTRTLFLDPKAARLHAATPIMLYQLKDKITDSGGPRARLVAGLLPVLLMAARTRYSKVFGLDADNASQEEMLIVWLSSHRSTNMQLLATLSVASTRANLADTLTVLTAQPYDLREPKDMAALICSPSTLVVPHGLLQQMTQRGKDLLAVQVHFH
ncbi:uncharacterized protein LOC111065306 [Drosophila obscura]|uniref:uncharacterized protein LOC111065306 n=1 Tax=Drosophila obscura TaxID=7282 RepID=UPI001BB0F019|nr:uncharacterized protein LOC111065306 [Drosophila obscura]